MNYVYLLALTLALRKSFGNALFYHLLGF